MKLEIDKNNDKALYIQIVEQIKHQILLGELLPGFRLPPERKLAEKLGVNRTTVLNAYRELKAEGLISSQVGKGTVVLSYKDEVEAFENIAQEPLWSHIFSEYSSKFDFHMVNDLLTLANRQDIISFATGIASPELGPIEALQGIEKEIIENKDYKALLHSPTEGFKSIRETVCNLMNKRGVFCEYNEVMMVSGSQQGIDLIAKIILDPGDIVVVEEPSFFPAINVFKTLGARVIGIPVDEKGMKIDILEQYLQRYRPKLIYTMPTFQNPTGYEMNLERRKKLVELAYKYKVLILEDDAYGDLCYEGNSLPMLKSMDNTGYVIYLSTFSKNVFPGLRLGWIVAHEKIIKRCAAVKQIMDLHSNTLSQWIIERFINKGAFEIHMLKICREYRLRRDTMYSALLKNAPKGMSFYKPRGGYYIWCKLPEPILGTKLMRRAAKHNITFVPGATFFFTERGEEYIRLNFTFAPLKHIEEGIKRLCAAIEEELEASIIEEDFNGLEINPIV